MFAYAATELLRVMEEDYKLKSYKLYKLFKVANWSGILYDDVNAPFITLEIYDGELTQALLRFTGDNEVLLWEQDIYLNVRTARKDTRFSWG